MPNIVTELLKDNTYVSLSGLEQSLSSSVTSSSTSLTDSRLKISNLLNSDIIFPVNYKNLSESIYFGSAFVRTKNSIANIIDNYPIGLSGSTTSTLYLEDIERANNFISTLNNYDWWVFRQICGETLTSSTMSFTATATAIREALSATITTASTTYVIPVIIRDGNNLLQAPQGVGARVTTDNFYTDILGKDPDDIFGEYDTYTLLEQILSTAVSFDYGIQKTLHKDWSGTASEKFNIKTYDGIIQTRIVPDVFTEKTNRSVNFQKSVPIIYSQLDYQNVLERVLESMAEMFDEIKIYVDGMKYLFKNYWAKYDKLPKGYIQQLVAHQYGVELFSSENKIIKDDLRIRDTYKTQKEITFEFWNRILCSLMYILKTKGTIESIRASARAYGFTPSLLQIYETADYKSSIDGYYNSARNSSVARFRKETYDNKKVFAGVSANTTSTSLSAVSLSAFTIHVKARFPINIFNASASGLSGVLCSIAPSAEVTYNCLFDTQNQSTSGFPYISFTFRFGSSSLTTGYNFISNAQKQSVDGYWNLFFSKDILGMYATNGYLISNYTYYDPRYTTTSASLNSLSSAGFTGTSINIGSSISASVSGLVANISNFYINRTGYSETFIKNVIRDSGYLNTVSGFNYNVVNWKFNEYNVLNSSSANHILNASNSSITGAPTFLGSAGLPYEYMYDAPAFYNDDIAGFKNQKLDSTSGLHSYNDEGKKNLRVGISLASPINQFLHSTLGSNFGELYAHPLDYYSQTGGGQATYSYSLATAKTNELFLLVGNTRNQIYVSEFLKFINRISGHLSSFFSFIDQLIPVSQILLEKGIIIENPINQRIVLSKSFISNNKDNVSETTVSANKSVIVDRDLVSVTRINNPATGHLDNNIVSTTRISNTFIGNVDSEIVNKTNIINSFSASQLSDRHETYSDSISASLTSSVDRAPSITSNVQLNSYVPNVTEMESSIMGYIPRNMLLEQTKTYYYDVFKNSILNNRLFINSDKPQDKEFFLNVVLDKEKILLSTSLTALDENKKMSGVIYIVDKFGRKIQTDYEAVQLDLTDCTLSGYNRFRFIVDGEDIPFNEQVKKLKIKNKSGIRFEINVKNAPNDGNNTNTKCNIYFTNLMNPDETGKAIELFLSDSMETYSRATGYSFTKQ